MMNWNFATTSVAAALLAVPALTLAPQAQDLKGSLEETVRALEALAGLAPRVAAGEPQALAAAKDATEPADLPPPQADERLAALREEVSRLQSIHDGAARGAASPFAAVTTGLTEVQLRQLGPRLGARLAEAKPQPALELGFRVDPLRQGMNAFRAGRYEECIKALAEVKDDPRASYWRGRAYERLGKVDEAIAAYEECLRHPAAGEYKQRAKEDLEFLRWRRDFGVRLQPRVVEGSRP
jgi:tetratricopeptide (TPR) repeat protein